MRSVWCFFLAALLIGCGGGGGGSTGGGATVAVEGRVLWIETGAAPDPAASVRIAGTSTTTDPIDGSFTLQAPQGSQGLTVSYTPAGGSAIIRTFALPALTEAVDLGDLYIGPGLVSVQGRAVESGTTTGIAGATVTIGGQRTRTDGNGNFTVANVAFSNQGLAVFLGLQGRVSATGFFDQPFSPTNPATGVSQVGNVALVRVGTNVAPPPPFNVRGRVLPVQQGANSAVTALNGRSLIRTVRADAQGNYRLWLPVGTYTIRAVQGPSTGQATVQVADLSVVKTVDVTLP